LLSLPQITADLGSPLGKPVVRRHRSRSFTEKARI
jgi:hypothetical protein